MKKILLILIFVAYGFANELTLGIVPQQSPLKLSKKWLKVTKYLKEQTGINVIFKTKSSIPLFEKDLYNGVYDISYMNPYHFTVAKEKQNYTAFVRAKKNIVGIILSKEKKADFSFDNLKGKTFLFPAPNAFAATLLPKFELKEKFNFDVDKNARVLYVNSHDSVYKGISRGIGYLGGGIVRTFNNFKDETDKDKLNIVYKTNPYPSHPIAYNPRVSKENVDKLTKAFLNMPDEIKTLLSIKQFIKINDSEYDAIKSIGIK
jgi:phosphonate transport system substrate-binding protein